MTESTELFHIMRTTRAMRRLKPDPVPDELIRQILEAGVCAANGGNNQPWRFLVVKDKNIKEQVQQWYKKLLMKLWGRATAAAIRHRVPVPAATAASTMRWNT